MFAGMLDRIGGRLGLPDAWERRTKAAVLEAQSLITWPRGRGTILTASPHRFDPAVVHGPTGWKIVLPRAPGWRQVAWLDTTWGGVVLEASASRDGVWLETRIMEPDGGLPLAEAFEAHASALLRQTDGATERVRRAPGPDGEPGELRLAFERNGAPLEARLLMLGLKAHVIRIVYEVPARLADAAAALSDEAVAIGLESAHPPEPPHVPREEMARRLRDTGMSEEEIAEVLDHAPASA